MASQAEQPPFGVIYGGPAAFRKRLEYCVIFFSLIAGVIAAALWFTWHDLTWIEATSFLVGFAVINVGIGMAMHRHFSHKSFDTYPAIRYVLGAFASMACEGSILKWAADHRRHHAQADHCGDLHSPHIDGHCHDVSTWKGMWNGHIGWIFDDATSDMSVYGQGLTDDPVVMFYDRTRWFWYAASVFIFPGLYGYAFGGVEHMISSILFGGFVRTFFFLNCVMGVNSVGHRWGSERYPQDNHSKNNFWLALLTFGDGFHNNHHYFPRAAMAGHRWWEIDVNGYLIHGLEKLGLAWNVVRVPENILHPDARPSAQDNKPPAARSVA